MSVVRGALGPKLEATIKEKLAEEHEVLEGKRERVVVSDSCCLAGPVMKMHLLLRIDCGSRVGSA